MIYKVLIIDDNHSYIDTLKVNLSAFPFHYESAFKFQVAEKMLREAGSFIDRDTESVLLEYFEKTGQLGTDKKKAAVVDEDKIIPAPTVKGGPFRSAGYLLVIVEQNTERNIKGLDFIDEVVRTVPGFCRADFILLASSLTPAIVSRAAEMGIPVFEKPLRGKETNSLFSEKMEQLKKYMDLVSRNLVDLGISSLYQEQRTGEVSSEPEQPKPRRARKKKDES